MWIPVMVLALVAAGFVVLRQMHIFQLNTYQANTQARWLSQHRLGLLGQSLVLVVGLLSLLWSVFAAITLMIILLITIWANHPKQPAKKPLHYTARVNRMLVTIGVLFGLLGGLICLAPASLRMLTGLVWYVLSPIWVILANWINAPIEAMIRRGYLNDAARMLASHPNLIKIGITGSYGKTSVKYYLATLLKNQFSVLMTPQSYNTPMGITKTIRAELRATHEIFICEMGAERIGEIKQDCDLVNPTIGVITAIGEQHLVTFGSQAAILQTKLELAEAVKGKGTLYLNGDDEILRAHQPDQIRHLYGLDPSNQTYAFDIHANSAGTTFSISHRGQVLNDLVSPLLGVHTIQNLTGAIAVGLDLGLTPTQLRIQLKKLTAAPHRLELVRHGQVLIIDDAYNSNPAGAKAALDALCLFDATKILITPGMVELGERQEGLNEAFGAQASVCDYVYLIGAKQTIPITRGLLGTGYDPARLIVLEDVQEAIKQASALPTPGQKVILLENDLPDNY